MTYSKDIRDLNPELAAMPAVPASKYKNAKTEVRGMSFQSGHEATGVVALIVLEEQHLIFALRLQVRFPLPGHTVYIADACYLDKQLRPHVVDFKGVKTQAYKIKKRLFREKYHKEIEAL